VDPNPNPTPAADQPGSLVMPASAAPVTSTLSEPAAPAPLSEPDPAPAPQAAELALDGAEPEASGQGPAEEEAPVADEPASTEPDFTWQASEYIHHAKGFGWYLIFAAVLVVLLGVAYLTHEWLGGGVFAIMAVAIVVYARKAPRTLTYALSANGISIEQHHYPFTQFRTFAVLPDMAWHTIDLEPTQRFMPRLTILFEDDDFDTVVNHLAEHLPRVDRQPDMVERATRYLRF
jgi:hypothetical protein